MGSSMGANSSPMDSGATALRTMNELSSPWLGIRSLPRQAMPMALRWVSMNGSSSSTTISSSTLAAKSRIIRSGSGQTMPSLSTGASGKASLT